MKKLVIAVVVLCLVGIFAFTNTSHLKPMGCNGDVQVSTTLRGLRLFNQVGETTRMFTSPIPAGRVREVVQGAWNIVGLWFTAFNDAVNGRPMSEFYAAAEAEHTERQKSHDDGCNPCVPVTDSGTPGTAPGGSSSGGSGLASLGAGTYGGARLSASQARVAAGIVAETRRVGMAEGWSEAKIRKAAIIALATAKVESQFGAYKPYSRPNQDNDAGYFQQRVTKGWYSNGATPAERLRDVNDVAWGTRTFLLGNSKNNIPGLDDIRNWENRSVASAAQAVQVSAFPSRYAEWERMGAAIYDRATEASKTPGGEPAGSTGSGAVRPVKAAIGARFGATGSWSRYHTGDDYRAGHGTPVRAVKAGVITYAGNKGNWAGNHVAIRHGDGYSTMYSHLSGYTVTEGDRVERNSIIGQVGNTGRSFGAHLHFEVYPPGVKPGDVYRAIDPSKWLREQGAYGGPGALPGAWPEIEVPAPPGDVPAGNAPGGEAGGEVNPDAERQGVDCGVDVRVGSWAGAARIGTWNIFGRERNKEVAAGIRAISQQADVIGLQEMSAEADRAAVRRSLPGWRMVGGNVAVPIVFNTAVFDYVREGRQHVNLDNRVEGGAVPDKWIVWVQLRSKATGQTFYVVNTHLLWSVDRKGKPQNEPQRIAAFTKHLKATAALVESFRSARQPVFVTMDSNVDFGNSLKAGDPLLGPLKTVGLVANWQTLGERPTHGSRAIDTVWSVGAAASSQQVLGKYGSDHSAVVVTYASATSNPTSAGVPGDTTSKGKSPSRSLPTKGMHPNTQGIMRCVAVRYPKIKDYSTGGGGEHATGRALDIMIPGGPRFRRGSPDVVAQGDRIAKWMWDNRDELGVWYIVWDKKIISTTRPDAGWIDYSVGGQPPHYDHIHVSVKQERAGNARGTTCNV